VRLSLKRVDQAVTEGATDGYIKLVLRGQTVLGAQVVAPRAAEMIQEVALAMQRRLPVSVLSMVHIYPAYSYGLHQANDEFWRQQAASGPLSAALAVLRRVALR
jgi:pyruvate/2-oxoglutarate dehydrogenase complex dihydrolipoamide dehydrogenase (E3) component